MPTELEELLRRSLSAEAERIEPGGDGLRRIRERTVRPARVRWRWRTPALVLAGAVAVVAALAAAPAVLPALTARRRPRTERRGARRHPARRRSWPPA